LSGELRAAPPGLPFVSIVVTLDHDADLIQPCLMSLERMSYPPDRRAIVIVSANGSDPGAEPVMRSHSGTYLRARGDGVAAARNEGIRASGGDVVAFTDADCLVSQSWLDELVKPFAVTGVGAVAGEIVPYPGRTRVERYAARRRSHSQARPLGHVRRPFAMTPNVAFRRDVFDRVGAFDLRFPGGGWEDADLCWRFLRLTDLELVYAPKAVVFHRYRATVRDFFVQHVRYGRGLALLHAKYSEDLAWGWPQRKAAYAALGEAIGRLATTAILRGAGRGDPVALDTAYFDVLRQLAQRLGFVGGRLTSRARRTTA
jgi:GT2 family glycosyltransferase